ncbi:MAG: endonuclease III [Planctomycetota bacterium]|nr:MAG: endonuclease III [Planctomycetota bacterium]
MAKKKTKQVKSSARGKLRTKSNKKTTTDVSVSPAYVRKVCRALAKEFPDAKCSLRFRNPLELLIATILSAQCTDERVNKVTADLFKKYRTANDYAQAPLEELEKDIQSTGFYRNKAKNIQACCRALAEEHGGKVPKSLDVLVKLPGVGRKTANVVLGTAYGLPTGVVVDTHVGRISRRLGLTDQANAEKVEQDLMKLLPKSEWIDFSHRMIQHGRKHCAARKPKCDTCPMNDFCPRIGVET